MNSVKKIFITGTPCVGKSTISEKLSKSIPSKIIHISELVNDKQLFEGIDEEKGYKIVNEKTLCREINKIIDLETESEFIIVDGHLSHFCKGADWVIVLRLNPNILKNRLKERGYSDSKIFENLEAEAMGVCSIESYDIHGDNSYEINTTNLSLDEIIAIIQEIIYNNKKYPIGSVDFMEWLLEN